MMVLYWSSQDSKYYSRGCSRREALKLQSAHHERKKAEACEARHSAAVVGQSSAPSHARNSGEIEVPAMTKFPARVGFRPN